MAERAEASVRNARSAGGRHGAIAPCLAGVALVLGLASCGSSRTAALSATDWQRAEQATMAGDWQRAAEYWNHIRTHERPTSARAQLATAEALAALGQSDDALALLEHGLALFPEDPDFLLARARLQRRLGYRRAAESDAWAAVRAAPDSFEGWLLLGRLRLELDSPTQATVACEQALKLRPDHPEAALLAARAWRGAGDLDRSHDHYAHALSLPDQRTYELLLEAASLHATSGSRSTRTDAALGWIADALELVPQCPRASFVRGCLLERSGDSERAVASYRRAIEIDNFHLAAMTNAALLHVERGEYDRAKELVDRILVLDLEQDPLRRRALRELVEHVEVPTAVASD